MTQELVHRLKALLTGWTAGNHDASPATGDSERIFYVGLFAVCWAIASFADLFVVQKRDPRLLALPTFFVSAFDLSGS